ncbi:hypothetical protein ACFLWX_03165 [Chloroflexota bacterium]
MNNKVLKVEPYIGHINLQVIDKWNGVVRVWNEPKSAVEGAEVIDQIKEPVEVTIVEEQKDMYGSTAQRARIRYGEGREGWVLYDALVIGEETLKDDPFQSIRLTKQQQKEGYWVEKSCNNALVWHDNNQIALLCSSPDINRKVRDVVEKRRKELKEVEEKTGWKPDRARKA